jgi:hypothetical protein
VIELNTTPDESEQRKLLYSLREGGGYGILSIVSRRGDVLFAASPVPALTGYEIVCASPDRLYDIWKDGDLVTPNQTREQIRSWVHANTPEWLYDDSTPTEGQKAMLTEWVEAFFRRYPGVLEVKDP